MVHEICRKMIDEALAAQHADVDTVKQKRGTEFRIDDAKASLAFATGPCPARATGGVARVGQMVDAQRAEHHSFAIHLCVHIGDHGKTFGDVELRKPENYLSSPPKFLDRFSDC